jgi:hypothetical protein
MKTCTHCKQSKPLADFGPYKRAKDGLFYHCRQCVRERANAWRATPHGRARALETDRARSAAKVERARELRSADIESARERDRLNYHRHREAILARQRARYHADIATARERQVAYRRQNPVQARLWYANRRLTKSRATPAWTDFDRIAAAYAAADLLMQVTGDWYEVDHVVPLRGKIGREHVVCGLHVDYNLAVLPRSDNRRKSNRFWPDMPVNA